jgi:coenzyme F420 biosynthesis associated uncharacterized protein
VPASPVPTAPVTPTASDAGRVAPRSEPPRSEPVDWGTAARVARLVARKDKLADTYLAASLTTDFEQVTREAEQLVADFTGLVAPGPASAGVVDRAGWIDANVASMRRMLGALDRRLVDRFGAGPVGAVGRQAAGTELGVLLGYMSQRVLGQYDLLMPDDEADPTPATDGDVVYYVGPNVLALEKRFGFRPVEFRRWVAIHELTHRAQFTAVPWLRGHFVELVHEMVGGIEPDPRSLVRAFARAAESLSRGKNPFDEAGIVGLFASDRQRAVLSQVQALMSLLEGHGNYVMNALGRSHVHGVERMERVLHARRTAGGVAGQVNKALGLEMKLRQYEVGERFIEAVVELADFAALDAAWTGPEALPTLAELADARAWLRRVDAGRPAVV